MKGIGNSILESWRKILNVCAICDLAADRGRLCVRCRDVLPWNDSFCECCGQPLPSTQPAGVTCSSCQTKRPPYEKARAPLIYEFPVDAVIKAIKFRRQLSYVPAFTELLLQTLQDEFAGVDALLPVPLHRRRQMLRGFNQAIELARPLQKATGLPVVTQALRRRATLAQTGLDAEERQKNLKDAFAIAGRLQCRHPLIVDDVITTGVTCAQLAIEARKAGADSVSVLAVARASARRP